LGLLGDIGGVAEILIFILGFLVHPVSKFAFYLEAFKRLYKVRTVDKSLFPK